MGLTKTEIFSTHQNQLAQMMKALAHPARIAILQEIMHEHFCINSTLVHKLGLAQPTISMHLKELKNAGIIKGSVEGTSISYCIDEKGWSKFQHQIQSLRIL